MRLTLAALLLLCACAQFPELDATQTPGVADAAYPRLLPLERLLSGADPLATPQVRGDVEARTAALRARAARLSGPVVDEPVKTRMRRGVAAAR